MDAANDDAVSFSIEQNLRDIYYDPARGFQSKERLYHRAREEGLGVTRKMVDEWLKEQDAYTRYKPIVRKLPSYRKTWVRNLGEQIQMDLVDMQKYSRENKGFKWILTSIEILSRFAFAIPVYRKDTKSMTEAVGELLDQFHTRFGEYPKLAQFDDGKEFYNVGVKYLLESHGVKYFSTFSEKKAAVVERFNRTLKGSMWKYFYSVGNYKWTEVLPNLVENYNDTKHSTIGVRPSSVNKKNEWQVWLRLYGGDIADYPAPKYRVGDTVRVSKYKNIFGRGFEPNFSEEIFKITKVYQGDPVTYEIEDHTGEVVLGRFYERELSEVNKQDNEYRIDKILKRKTVKGKKMAFVRWKSYGPDADSWIGADTIHGV